MTHSPLSSLNIKHCISSNRKLTMCFILVIICNSYYEGNKLKVLQSENKSIHTCDKLSPHPDLNASGILGFYYGTKPLQPFDSGDPPICRLEASPSSPIPVILISLGRFGTKVMWQVISRLTGHCFLTQEYNGKILPIHGLSFQVLNSAITGIGYYVIFVYNNKNLKRKEELLVSSGNLINIVLAQTKNQMMDYE